MTRNPKKLGSNAGDRGIFSMTTKEDSGMPAGSEVRQQPVQTGAWGQKGTRKEVSKLKSKKKKYW